MHRNSSTKFFAILISLGLIFFVSCAQKTIKSDTRATQKSSVQDQALLKNEKDLAREKEERIAQERIEEQKRKEQVERQARQAAKKKFITEDIYFAYDSAKLTESARKILKDKAYWLKQNVGVKTIIEGHCDERGTTEYNLALGERRAKAAKSYLINLGISSARLTPISYGEEKPVVLGSGEHIWKQNRRCHFITNEKNN